MSKKKFNPWWIVYGVFALIFLAFVFAFLLHRNKGCQVSGWDAMMQMGVEAWLWAIGGTSLVAFVSFKIVRNYQSGNELSHSAIFGLLAFLFIVWAPAADIKANCGTTGMKGNPANQVQKDDGRIPAEEMLKQ